MITVLGTKIDTIRKVDLDDVLMGFLTDGRQHTIHTPNPEILLSCRADKRVQDYVNHGSLNLCDGTGIQLVQKLQGREVPERITGNDLIYDLLKMASKSSYKVWLIGGQDNETNFKAQKKIEKDFPGVIAAGEYGGKFEWTREGELVFDEQVLGHINEFKPDIVLASIGHPKQDVFIAKHLLDMPSVKIACGVGGVVDFLAGIQVRAPQIFRQLGIEWLYRLIKEPKRIGRIWRAVIVFPLTVFFDKISQQTTDNKQQKSMSKIRTRFAPSPTGYMHIGNLRTALYAYLFAKHNNGDLVLRIEDTDQSREVKDGVKIIVKTLEKMGISYNEGIIYTNDGKVAEKGDKGPYMQSERLDIYREYAQKLVDDGKAYYCFCSPEHLTKMREEQQAKKLPTKYDRGCLNLGTDEVKKKLDEGTDYVIRLKVPEGKTSFEDVVRGKVEFDNSEVDDQVLMKSDGFPTYHLANIIDDHLMGITHVIRGEEWLSSTPKHVILYNCFGWDVPTFAHLPLLLNPDKSKLSKRQGDVAVEDYLAKGYLPEAIINFIALLGFNPRGDQEVYTIDELIKEFDLSKINKGGAVFNTEKLDWLNGHYIREMKIEDLAVKLTPFWQAAGFDPGSKEDSFLNNITRLEQTRIKKLDEAGEGDYYFKQPEYEGEMLVWKKSDKDKTKEVLDKLIEFFGNLEDNGYSSEENIEQAIRGFVEKEGLDNGSVLWPIRVAMSGKKASPSPFELTYLFGKEEIISRLKQATKFL